MERALLIIIVLEIRSAGLKKQSKKTVDNS